MLTPNPLDSFASAWTGLLTIVALLFISLVLLIELIHWQTREGRRRIASVFLDSFRQGWRRGWRGYFAPLHRRPWKAARCAWRASDRSWGHAVVAWFKAIEAMCNERPDVTGQEEEQ